LRVWRVGFQPHPRRREPAERWGFPATGVNGRPSWLRIPRGIVLPWLEGEQLWQLKVRTSHDEPKYLAVAGGRPGLYGIETLTPVEPAVVAEGEFDVLLIWQEVGDLASVVSLGSASRRPTARVLAQLARCSRLLLAADADMDGDQAAERLANLLAPGCSRRLRPPRGKDVTDFWRLGGDVRKWVTAGLELDE
jgi:hypothetical protein